ncbi:MAG: redoxin domain-containing protein [Bacteroidales bacterium]|nr:redoxin domain-containing protein [Bacteroidales bacterium]
MRKLSALFLLLCISFQILGQKKYQVDFFIHNIEDTLLYVGNYIGSHQEIIDSIKISKDGSFHWNSAPQPLGMYMMKNSQQRDMFSFVLGKSDKFSIEIYDSGEAFVKGCAENDAYLLYQFEHSKYQKAMYYYRLEAQAHPELQDSLYKALEPVLDSFKSFQTSFFELYPENLITVVSKSLIQNVPSYFIENGQVKQGMEKDYAYYYRTHYWDSFRFDDSRILYTPYFIKKFNSYIMDATVQDADSVSVAIDDFVRVANARNGREYADYVLYWYLERLPDFPFSFNELVYKHIMETYGSYLERFLTPGDIELQREYLSRIEKFLPGKIMPNIVAKDVDGKPQTLYAQKHRFTVLFFFAATCESCKKNLDVLLDLYKLNKDYYDFEIFAVDIDPDVEISKARQRSNIGFPWVVTFADASSLSEYGFILDHTPELYILDKDKRILNKTAIYNHVEQTMDAAMRKIQSSQQ